MTVWANMFMSLPDNERFLWLSDWNGWAQESPAIVIFNFKEII
jgi:hypothetical protein